MMKVLVTGANGLLGQHLVRQLVNNGYAVTATGRGTSRLPFPDSENFRYYSADLTNGQSITDLVSREKPEVIVHAGAMTQVDECEQNQELCFNVNVHATAQLLVEAEQHAAFFIYLSTDFVFDGEQGNYQEDDHHNPVSWYGFTKVQAESTVETSDIPWAIIRTCLVYGNTASGNRSNIVSWVRESLAAGKEIKVVNDQHRTPTYVDDLTNGILLVIGKRASGVFHISGEERFTPYDMAVATADYFQLDKDLIQPVDASVFSQPAKRPPKTGFDISKAKAVLGYQPISFKEALSKMAVDELSS